MTEKKITFGRIFWPAFWATLIVSILGTIIWVIAISGIIGGLGDFSPKALHVKDKTVLHMTLNGPVNERGDMEFDPGEFKMSHHPGLNEILYGLQNAKTDKKVKGVFIELGDLQCGFATAKEIRDAINDFESTGKFAVAYNSGEYISQKELYIASAADENYGFPTSNVHFLGLGAELAFFKKTLDKLDVEVQIIRGSNNDFKSAVEPFFLESMSDSARHQITTYISGIWNDIRSDIAKDRKLDASKLNEIAENALIQDVNDAVKFKLMDAAKYRDEVLDILRKKSGTMKKDELELQAFEKYARKKYQQNQRLMKSSKPNIAVILAEGGVSTSGEGLTSEEICKFFKEVREDKNIKTVVFRINSPGGSALASDEIWREVKLTNEKKKVIVSMGDVAASGGYYIAAPADRIFADPMTITGSIGVFGMIPYTGKMMENKLGITFDRATTNQHAVLTTNRRLTEEEMRIIQESVDEIYMDFKKRVSEGRGMSVEKVDIIARGRVWTGRDALRIGLVDELGGMQKAINYAAKKAKLKTQKIIYYPKVKDDKIADILEQLSEEDDAVIKMKNMQLPESVMEYYSYLKKLEGYQGIQMRMPFEIKLD